MSAAGHALWHALNKPQDWLIKEYEIVHKPSCQSFWVANGSFFFDGHNQTPPCLGLLERHWLYWKASSLRTKYVAALLRQEPKC